MTFDTYHELKLVPLCRANRHGPPFNLKVSCNTSPHFLKVEVFKRSYRTLTFIYLILCKLNVFYRAWFLLKHTFSPSHKQCVISANLVYSAEHASKSLQFAAVAKHTRKRFCC